MDEYNAKSLQTANAGQQMVDYIPPTQRRQLEQKKGALITELQRVQNAIDALDSHPELEQFHETLRAALR